MTLLHGKSSVLWVIILLAFGVGSAQADIRTIHQELAVELNPAQRSLGVSAKIQITGSGVLKFRLAQNFVITGLVVDGKNTAPKRIGQQWRVDLNGNRHHEVTFSYRGSLTPPPKSTSPFGTVNAVSSPEGSFLPAGSGWHPSFDGHAFSYRLDVTVPEPQRAVAPGRLVLEQSSNDTYRAVFESEAPLHGVVLMAGPYRISERQHGKIKLRTYFHPEISDLSEDYLKTTAGYLDFYENWIGIYPYSAFHIVSGTLPVGLGYPGLTFMGKRVLALPFIRFSSLGHEVLHNWWGNAVDVNIRKGNWSEGLTTFMADYTYALRRSKKAAKAMRIAWLRDYAALPPARDRPVTTFVSRSHDAEQIIGYNKVAFIFHMLRQNIGQDAFDQGIRLFWQRHAMGTASWANLQSAFETSSGQNLEAFFAQWLNQSGAPKLILEHAVARGKTVSFNLRQATHGYGLNVPVDVVTRNGTERFDAPLKEGDNHLEYTAKAPVLGLVIDPDFDVFRRLDQAETPPILRDVTLNSNTHTIILSKNRDITNSARLLAGRLLDGDPHAVIAGDGMQGALTDAPVLLIGKTATVAGFLKRHGLPTTPEEIRERGTARVWATRRNGQNSTLWPLVVIEIDDLAALQALMRPLPHYRRQGYVVFQGSKGVAKGVPPAGQGPLSVFFN